MNETRFWNLPNSITVGRIAVIPIVIWMLWDEPTLYEHFTAWFLFVGAMLTDILDGWLARRMNLVSPMGAYLDPMADKLMVTTVLVMLIPIGWVPAWIVVVLLCRELAITGLRGIASQQNLVLSASTLGKVKTSFQSTSIGFLLWHVETWGIDPHSAGIVLLYIATLFALISGAEYLILFYKASNQKT